MTYLYSKAIGAWDLGIYEYGLKFAVHDLHVTTYNARKWIIYRVGHSGLGALEYMNTDMRLLVPSAPRHIPHSLICITLPISLCNLQWICLNFKMNFSPLQNVFVQITNYIFSTGQYYMNTISLWGHICDFLFRQQPAHPLPLICINLLTADQFNL